MKYSYDKDLKIFQILDDNSEIKKEFDANIQIYDDYDLADYKCIVLNNNLPQCSENSIFQVYVHKQRIGWIFPIQAIHSNEHNYSDNEHFLKYAFIAWCYLLKACKEETLQKYDYDIFDYYPSYANILVLCNENCEKTKFDYDLYYISLYQYGYSEIGQGNLYSQYFDNTNYFIKLKRQSELLDDQPYIHELIKTQFALATSDLSRFYLYYQVIEILIAKVFDIRFMSFLNNLKSSTDLFDKTEKISELTNERRRVSNLVNEFSVIDSSTKNDLNNRCKALLCIVNDDKNHNDFADLLYDVRCLIVHRLYTLKSENYKLLSDINDVFLDLLLQIMLTFRIPNEYIIENKEA